MSVCGNTARNRPIRARLLIVALAAAAACGDRASESRFSAEEAVAVAGRFHAALAKGDVAALVPLCRAPFRYKESSRRWTDADAIRANLAKEVPRVIHLVRDLDRFEALSIEDLERGRWPRGRVVPKDAIQAEIGKLGLERDGFVVRVHSDRKAGYLLVLNREGRELLVQMLDV